MAHMLSPWNEMGSDRISFQSQMRFHYSLYSLSSSLRDKAREKNETMKLYRFSSIQTQQQLMEALEYVHIACHQLCQKTYGSMLPNAGNMTIFCHYPEEYQAVTQLRKRLTDEALNFNGKYFKLHQPITFSAKGGIPEATYSYLYIRHPDPYRSQVGDIDFYLEPGEYVKFKQNLASSTSHFGMRRFERDEPDMVELFDPDSDVLAYISNVKIADLVEK